MNEKAMTSANQARPSAKVGYVLGDISYSFCMLLPAFITYFATENLGIPILAVTTMMMLVKIFDGVTDIVAGVLIDKTKSPKGKARPWFLRMAIPYALTLAGIFYIPNTLSMGAKIGLLAVLYALCVSVFGTVIGVAKFAIIPLMSSNQKERGWISALGEGISGTMVGLGMAAVLPMVAAIGWRGTFTAFGVIALVTSLVCYLLVRENAEAVNAEMSRKAKEKKYRIGEFFSALFHNKYALWIFVYVVGVFTAAGFMQTGGTYYWKYYVGNEALFSVCMLLNMIGGLAGTLLLPLMMKHFSRRKCFMIGMATCVVMYGIVVLTGGRIPPVLFVCFCVSGIGVLSCGAILPPVMAADAVDYGEWKTGIRTEGVTTCVVNVGVKVGGALASFIMGVMMDAGGFVEGGAEQTESAVQAIFNMYIYGPLVVAAILFVIIGLTYKLDKEYPTIIAELKSRTAAND